jgi:hypothetical protein
VPVQATSDITRQADVVPIGESVTSEDVDEAASFHGRATRTKRAGAPSCGLQGIWACAVAVFPTSAMSVDHQPGSERGNYVSCTDDDIIQLTSGGRRSACSLKRRTTLGS